jgi:predicted HD phosphohydrolase
MVERREDGGDGGEMEERWRRDGGEMEERWRRDGGEMEERWRRDGGEIEKDMTRRTIKPRVLTSHNNSGRYLCNAKVDYITSFTPLSRHSLDSFLTRGRISLK